MEGYTRALLLLVVGALVFGGAIIFHQNDIEQTSVSKINKPAPLNYAQDINPETKQLETNEKTSSIDNNSAVDFELIKRRMRVSHDPMIVIGRGDFSANEIAAYNRLHIIPFNPIIREDCDEIINEISPGLPAESCVKIRKNPRHPYQELSISALKDLAFADATASVILARKSKIEDGKVAWYLRAAALSEKTGPLIALANHDYNGIYLAGRTNGKPVRTLQTKTVVVRLALENMAEKLGDPRANPNHWRELIRGQDNYLSLFSESDQLVHEFINLMSTVQRDITGSTQVLEVFEEF